MPNFTAESTVESEPALRSRYGLCAVEDFTAIFSTTSPRNLEGGVSLTPPAIRTKTAPLPAKTQKWWNEWQVTLSSGGRSFSLRKNKKGCFIVGASVQSAQAFAFGIVGSFNEPDVSVIALPLQAIKRFSMYLTGGIHQNRVIQRNPQMVFFLPGSHHLFRDHSSFTLWSHKIVFEIFKSIDSL